MGTARFAIGLWPTSGSSTLTLERCSASRGAIRPQRRPTVGAIAPTLLQRQMEPESIVEFEHDRGGDEADRLAHPLNRNRSDLLHLAFESCRRPSGSRLQQHLKRIDPLDVGGDGNDCDHATAQPGDGGVGSIAAHDNRRPAFARLSAPGRGLGCPVPEIPRHSDLT
jgi:hypothetical protein